MLPSRRSLPAVYRALQLGSMRGRLAVPKKLPHRILGRSLIHRCRCTSAVLCLPRSRFLLPALVLRRSLGGAIKPQEAWPTYSSAARTNEITNGLLRQYLPQGTDLSGYTQKYLDAIALRLSTRPRKTLGVRTPADLLAQIVASTA